VASVEGLTKVNACMSLNLLREQDDEFTLIIRRNVDSNTQCSAIDLSYQRQRLDR
jgi:hypothetical protein